MKAICLKMIPQYNLVQMVATYLNCNVQKKMVSQQLQYMMQLVDSAEEIDKLNLEKRKLRKEKEFL